MPNCVLIVIPRPEEDGYSATEVWEMVQEEYTKKDNTYYRRRYGKS